MSPAQSPRHHRMVDAEHCDLRVVDELLRLQLDARRLGLSIRLVGVAEELRELLVLVGVADLFALETGREPQLGEEGRVDEVVEPGDPPT